MVIYIGTFIFMEETDTENFSWKNISHLMNPCIIGKRIDSIRTIFRNTNGYPNWIINQVFEEIKVKQRDPVQNSNVSNENEVTQNSN